MVNAVEQGNCRNIAISLIENRRTASKSTTACLHQLILITAVLPVIQEFLESIHTSGLTVIDAPAEAVIRVTKYLTLDPRVRSILLPHCKRLLHARIGKEFHANLALDRPSHHTLQVGPPGYLFRRDPNL